MAIKKYTISRDDNLYEAWPDLTKTIDGKLVCVFSECTHHVERSYTRIILTESSDDGRTWTNKRALTESTQEKEYFYNCPRITTLSDNRLAIISSMEELSL